MYLGSDALALAPLTQQISYLEEGDWAGYARWRRVFDEDNSAVERVVRPRLRRADRQGQLTRTSC